MWEEGSARHGPAGSLDLLDPMSGPGVAARRIVVWKPPGYDAQPENRYAVLYANDGQNLFDPRTSYLGMDWRLGETAAALIRTSRMTETIIVGIYATDDRFEEYADTDRGRAYLRFVAGEIKPAIDAAYRTRPGRESTVMMGSSMGGLCSLLAVLDHPDVFSAAACLSPVFPPETVARVQSERWEHGGLRLYIDNGGDEMDRSLQPGIDAMLAALAGRGLAPGRNLMWYRDAHAPHNEDGWADRVWRPLMFLLGPG